MSRRIEDLLQKLTLEEKISLAAGVDNWHTRAIPRLGIPAIKVTDGPHGARTADEAAPDKTIPATCFPTGVALAATWDPALVRRIGAAIGEEVRARGCSVLLGPCVNIHRTPLGGRNFESYSEDPYLSARMAAAVVTGIQSRKVGACVKHFALNNQEYERMTISSDAGERAMREIYFPSFEKAVKEAGTWSVMCSYNKVNGDYASANRRLLTELLKDEWGFDGPVISDWFAVHSTGPAAKAGLDLEMPGPAKYFNDALLDLVKQGKVAESIIDYKVRRLLGLLEKTGAMDGEAAPPDKIKESPAHRRLAREAAEAAIILLKNEGGLLPLRKEFIHTLAVIGPNAAEASIQGGGSAQVNPEYEVSPLEGLRKLCGDKVKIVYELGCPNARRTRPLDPAYLLAAPDGEYGLTGAYFPNSGLAGKPALTRIDKDINFMWGLGEPPVKCQGGNFSVRWTGIFQAPVSGVYKFGLAAFGWARLFIDGEPVCGSWGNKAAGTEYPSREAAGKLALVKGKSYNIRVEFRRNDYAPLPFLSVRLGCTLPLPPDLRQRAVNAAAHADAAVIFTGLTKEYESEGFDRTDMDLPAGQAALIKAVAGANPNTVVVLNNGSPVAMKSWLNGVRAAVTALYPGQEGGHAIAAVLFGDVNPSGKLPDTYPVRLEDSPAYLNYPGENGHVLYGEGVYVGYRYYDAKKIRPQFPFGHGLSYTTFRYTNLKVTPVKAKAGQPITANVDITNTGPRAGKEVVQLYVAPLSVRPARPPQELKAFEKVSLEPGATKTVTFTLDQSAFAYYETARRGWAVAPGAFEIRAGSSSRDVRLKKKITLVA